LWLLHKEINVLRLTLLHLLLLFVPTLIYIMYLIFSKRVSFRSLGSASKNKNFPWFPLMLVGIFLVLASIIALAFSGGGEPDQLYQPPYVENGEIIPGQIK